MANWLGTVTNIGNDLLTNWTAGVALGVDYAWASAGMVEEIALMAQTDITGQKRDAVILSTEKVAEGFRVKVRIYAAVEAYPLHQIGVWAHTTGGDPVLLAIFQHRLGIQIPDKDETPDFVYTISLLLQCSNTGKWTVSLDPSILMTRSDMAEAMKDVDKVRVIRSRIRTKPDYDTEGDVEPTVPFLDVSMFTGTAEVSTQVSGVEYDAHNLSPDGDAIPDGTIIFKKLEE